MVMRILNGLDLANQRIQSVADPTSSTDGANKQYVDNFVRGLSWKDAVLCASTANIASLSAPGASIDGITLVDQCRVLLKNQTTASQNGIYTYTLSTTTLARSLDMVTGVDARGFAVSVRDGTVNDDTVWHVTSDPSIVATDSLTFTALGGAGNTYIAGAGLTESPAGTFNIVAGASVGITVNADDIAIASTIAGAGLTYASGVIDIGAGTGITVNANDVALASSVAGDGLAHTAGVLSVNTGLGITTSADNVTISSVVPVIELFSIGDGSTTTITVTFGTIATRDAIIQVYRTATPWEQVFPDISRPSTTTATITFATAPTTNQYRVVAQGR